MKKLVVIVLCLFEVLSGFGQEEKGQVDLFLGAELNYNDTDMKRLYNVLINVTPGVKWNIGHGWQVAGQLSYGAVNYGYEEKYNNIRLGIVALSKELAFGNDQHLKFTGGLFNRD